MGIVTKTIIQCDRCGSSVPVPSGSVPFDVADGMDGWVRVSGDRFLCPECSPGYDLLRARHKVELEDYIAGTS